MTPTEHLANLDAARERFAEIIDSKRPTLPFSPLTLGELNERVSDANLVIAYTFRAATRPGRELDDYDMARMTEAADSAETYSAAAIQRVTRFAREATQ